MSDRVLRLAITSIVGCVLACAGTVTVASATTVRATHHGTAHKVAHKRVHRVAHHDGHAAARYTTALNVAPSVAGV